jgi:hypothetical protein
MKNIVIMVPVLTTLLAVSVSVEAHHSFQAEYDRSKPLTLVGKLTKV